MQTDVDCPAEEGAAIDGWSRREFLWMGTLYGGGLALACAGSRAASPGASEDPARAPRGAHGEGAHSAVAPGGSGALAVLTPAEAETLSAAAERILPFGTDGAGAREAGCAAFVDRALAGPDAAALPLLRGGLAALDAAARARHACPFAALGPAERDRLLADVEDDRAEGWPADAPPSPIFFETLRAEVVIGLLADPRHGGNRDHVGWKLVGYPGPRHAGGGYSPEQMLGRAPIRAVWGRDL